MVIDFHVHVFARGWVPPRFFEGVAELAAASMRRQGKDCCAADMAASMAASPGDPDGSALVREMDEAGIDKGVVLPIDYGIGLGEPDVAIEELNLKYRDLAEKHPGRLIWFAGIDPRRHNAPELLRKMIGAGARGLKLQQATGFYPNGKETYRLLEVLCEHGLPVLFHCMHIIPPMKSKYCAPEYIDEVSADFPGLQIIAGHLGGPMHYRDWIPILKTRNNVLGDISLWQELARRDFDGFCRAFRELLDHVGHEKVLFGSDTPASRSQMANAAWVKLLEALPEKSAAGVKFTAREIEHVMGMNAASRFGL